MNKKTNIYDRRIIKKKFQQIEDNFNKAVVSNHIEEIGLMFKSLQDIENEKVVLQDIVNEWISIS